MNEKTDTQRYMEALQANAAAAEKYAAKARNPDHFIRFADRQRRKAASILSTQKDYEEIRKAQESGKTLHEIARDLGVAVGTVSRRKRVGLSQKKAIRRWERLLKADKHEYRSLLRYDRTGVLPRYRMTEETAGKEFHAKDPLKRIAAAKIIGSIGGFRRAKKLSPEEKTEQGERAAAARKTIGRNGGPRSFACLCGESTCPTCYMRSRQRASRFRRTCLACGYFDDKNQRIGDTVACHRCKAQKPGFTEEQIEEKLSEARKADRKKAREEAKAAA